MKIGIGQSKFRNLSQLYFMLFDQSLQKSSWL